jgi:uncharacterized protein
VSEPTTRRSKSLATDIAGPAGVLEAVVDASAAPSIATALICHPHPLQQGTMSNKVVTTVARAFNRIGADAVRFNFRGVGKSAGRFADGSGEREDALAAAAWCRRRWPGRPLYLGGFSFGAEIAAAIAARAVPAGLVTVAPPVERLGDDFVAPKCPWLLIHGDADEVVPPGPVIEWCASLPAPPKIVLLPGVGHFFHGRLAELAKAVTEAFGAQISSHGSFDAA